MRARLYDPGAMTSDAFYGPEQAGIHHREFGRLAGRAANLLSRSSAGPG